jgi:hypothetical protein
MYREWFRCKEQKNQEKFDYFYGPLRKNSDDAIRVNKERQKRMEKRKDPLNKAIVLNDNNFDQCSNEDNFDHDKHFMKRVRNNQKDLQNYYL